MEERNSILIVDDDSSNLLGLTSILKKDYKIYAVKDGITALEKARDSLPDLILLDIIMPDMDGFEILAELKRSNLTKDIPVIFITGMNESENERDGLAAGAADYVRKPFDPIVVSHRVRTQIKIVNLQRKLEETTKAAEDVKKPAKQEREPMPYGRVLIVDDMEANLYVAAKLMKPYKLHIETVESGREAVDKIKEGNVYDIIFMDHMMPEMDGIEATKHMRDFGYTGIIAALTAIVFSGQESLYLENGFDLFIPKPIDKRLLDSILIKYIRDRQPPEVLEVLEAHAAYRSGKNEIQCDDENDPFLIESCIRDTRKAVNLFDELNKDPCWYEDETAVQRYIINIHNIKSVLAGIGETAMSESAYELEVAGRENDTGFIKSGASEFLEQLRVFLGKLEQKFDTVAGDTDTDKNIEVLCDKLGSFIDMCEDYDRKGALDILAAMETSLKETKAAINSLKEDIIHSEFDKAAEKAAALKEKLLPESSKATGEEELPGGFTGSLLKNREIAGLDVAKGLTRYDGDEVTYLKVLRSYAASTRSMLGEIENVNREKLEDYKIKVHGIKGASYDIFAGETGKTAEELEKAAVNGDYGFITETNPGFLETTYGFLGKIESLLSAIYDENPKPVKSKPDTGSLSKLLAACDRYSMDEVDIAMAEIEKFSYEADDGLADWLRYNVDLMRFPQIVEKLTGII